MGISEALASAGHVRQVAASVALAWKPGPGPPAHIIAITTDAGTSSVNGDYLLLAEFDKDSLCTLGQDDGRIGSEEHVADRASQAQLAPAAPFRVEKG